MGDAEAAATGERQFGLFGASELRAGGIGSRGFIQPLMAAPPMVEGPPQSEVVAGLARRGQMISSPSGWRPVGRLAEVLEAAAAARSLVAGPPADPGRTISDGADVMGPDRIAMGRLGDTDLVLDLLPTPDGYRIRLVRAGDLAADLVDWFGWGALDPGADSHPPLSEGGSEWAAAQSAGVFSRTVPPMVETATVTGPSGPLLQQRITQFGVEGAVGDGIPSGRWLVLGVAEGERSSLIAAPAGPARVHRLLHQALLGGRIQL